MRRDMGPVFGLVALLCLGAAVAPAHAQDASQLPVVPFFGYGTPTLTYQYQCSCGYGYGYSSPPPPVQPTFPIPVPSPPPSPAYPSPSPSPAAPVPYYYPPTAPTYPVYPTYPIYTYPTYIYGYDISPSYFGYGYGYSSYGGYGGYGLSDTLLPAPTDPTSDDVSTASFSAASDPVGLAATNGTLAPGTCYCPYDSDWSAWAISDTRCRTALYRRCKYDTRLPCTWLDQYYGAVAPANATAAPTRPHEGDISDYLYNDCPPAPPCKCAGEEAHLAAATAGTTPSFSCCKQLTTYARVPFSGLSETAAEAACQAYSPTATPAVRAWIQRQLWHSQCPADSPQALYRLVDDPLLRTSRQASSGSSAGRAGVIGGLTGLAVLVVLGTAGALIYRKRRLAAAAPTRSPLLP